VTDKAERERSKCFFKISGLFYFDRSTKLGRRTFALSGTDLPPLFSFLLKALIFSKQVIKDMFATGHCNSLYYYYSI
jgi:hypothetical protein